MVIRALIFDINGTMTDILTNEWNTDIYRVIGNLLSYQGIVISPDELRNAYFQIMKEQRAASGERFQEFDAVCVFGEIMTRYGTDYTRALQPEKLNQLPLVLAEAYRAASRYQLQLYSGVKKTIHQLFLKYRLAILSDGQSAYAVPELNAVGLLGLFDPVIISGDFGYRKPDPRLFEKALSDMRMKPSEVLYVCNDMYRDVYGAQRVGIKTVFFRSNQGQQEKNGVRPDYIIYSFPELLDAVRFFEQE